VAFLYFNDCSWLLSVLPVADSVSNKKMGPFSRIRAHQSTRSSVRSAGVGGRAATPRIEKFRANSVYRTSSSCSKILKDKKYFNTVKIFRANYVFQGKRRLFKTLNDKKYILNTANSCTLCFQGKHKLLKNPEFKNYIQYSEKYQGKLCSNNLNVKVY